MSAEERRVVLGLLGVKNVDVWLGLDAGEPRSGAAVSVFVAESEEAARVVQWAGLDLRSSREMEFADQTRWWRTFSEQLRRRTHDRLGYCSHSPVVWSFERRVCDGCGFTGKALFDRGELF